MLIGVIVRWRTQFPGSGYDLWDGEQWLPISDEEYQAYRKVRGLSIHTNPRWSDRG